MRDRGKNRAGFFFISFGLVCSSFRRASKSPIARTIDASSRFNAPLVDDPASNLCRKLSRASHQKDSSLFGQRGSTDQRRLLSSNYRRCNNVSVPQTRVPKRRARWRGCKAAVVISSRASRSAIQSPMLEGDGGGGRAVPGTRAILTGEGARVGWRCVGGEEREVTSSLHNCVTLSGRGAHTDKNPQQTGFRASARARAFTHSRGSARGRSCHRERVD